MSRPLRYRFICSYGSYTSEAISDLKINPIRRECKTIETLTGAATKKNNIY